MDENGDPIYKIDGDLSEDPKPHIGDLSNTADESTFKDAPRLEGRNFTVVKCDHQPV